MKDEDKTIEQLIKEEAHRLIDESEKQATKSADEPLEERQAWLDSIFRAAPIGIGVVANRMLLEVNDRICEMTGYARDELLGKSARILYPTQEDFDFVGIEKYRQIQYRGIGSVETRWRRKDGTIIDIFLSSSTIIEGDLSAGVTFTALDITDRKQMEEELKIHRDHLDGLVKKRTVELSNATKRLKKEIEERKQAENKLRESAEKYRIHFSLSNDVMFSYNNQFKVLSVSPNVEKLLGYKPEELVGRNFQDLNVLHPDYMNEAVDNAIHVLSGETIYSSIYEFITKDGTRKFAEVNGVPLIREGQVVGVISVAKDITERIEMDRAFHEEAEKYLTHFSLANDVLYYVDTQFRLVSISASVENVLGYRPEELIGKPFPELNLIHPDDLGRAVTDTMQIISGEKLSPSIYRIITKDGAIKFGEVRSVPFIRQGQVVGVIAVARDMTKRIEMEEELKKHRDHLEDLVRERTAELMRTNELLNKEIEERKRTEVALKESEVHLRGMTDNLPAAVYQFYVRDTGEMGLHHITGRTFEFLGLKNDPRDFFPRFTACVAPEDRQAFLDSIQEAVRTVSRWDCEVRFIKPTGEEMYVRGISHPEQRENEVVFNGVMFDITQRKQAEEALRKSEAKYRFLAEKMNDIIGLTDLNLKIIYVSPSIEKIAGFTPEECMQLDPTEMMTPESFAHIVDVLGEELKREQLEGVDPERTAKVELEYYHKNGSTVWMETVASFTRDDTGRVSGIHVVSRDISDRKRAEHLIEISQKKFVAAFHDSPAPLVITDAESGEIIDVNQSCLTWSGYSLDEVIGHNTVELGIIGVKERGHLAKKVQTKGKIEFLEMKYKTKGGDIRDILHSARLIDIDNKPCILSHIHDITDQRRAEEKLKKHREQLEDMVRERTAELTGAYEQLTQENKERKATELALRSRESDLERGRQKVDEVNAALRVLLKHREEDKANMEMDVISNIKISVLPYIEKLEASRLEQSQKGALSLIKSHLNDIASPFIRKISSEYLGFTPSEIKVASLVKEGKTSKDIAELLNISLNTVITHRYNIRKKTGLKNKKMNLRSYLQVLE